MKMRPTRDHAAIFSIVVVTAFACLAFANHFYA
jgi:hypothetical protein